MKKVWSQGNKFVKIIFLGKKLMNFYFFLWRKGTKMKSELDDFIAQVDRVGKDFSLNKCTVSKNLCKVNGLNGQLD